MECVLKIGNDRINLAAEISSQDENCSPLVQSFAYSIQVEIYKLEEDIKIKRVNLKLAGATFSSDFSVSDRKHIYQFGKNRYFSCIWGYCRASVEIITASGETYNFFSGFMNVILNKNDSKNNELKQSVGGMIKFIIENNHHLLQRVTKDRYSIIKTDLGISKFKTLYTELDMLKEIVDCYNDNYIAFRRNLKYKLVNKPKIDKFEKLKKVTPETIKYISKHFEELEQVEYYTGIRHLNRNFKPKNVLTYEKIYDYDIYENQVVFGFIKFIINYIENRMASIKDEDFTVKDENDIKSIAFKYYEQYLKEIKIVLSELQSIYIRYKSIMKDLEITHDFKELKPTSIFMNYRHYSLVYMVIENWFKKGDYNFEGDKNISTFVTIDQIYEYYSLLRIISAVQKMGYSLQKSYNCNYSVEGGYSYKDENTFELVDDEDKNSKITVYYQPVVYSYQFENNIFLYRLNGIKKYYTPDFIIKIENSSNQDTRYIIMDSKWQGRWDIETHTLSNIINKYAFSLQAAPKNVVEGVYILQGKDDEKNNIYLHINSELSTQMGAINKPKIGIIPFTPLNENEKYLQELFGGKKQKLEELNKEKNEELSKGKNEEAGKEESEKSSKEENREVDKEADVIIK